MKRIKYISKFNKEMTPEEVYQLAADSAKNNAENNITGILMTSGKIFFQIIEGPDAAIDRLWGLIIHDFRHTDIVVLKTETGSFDRLFPDWSMKGMALGADSEIRLEPIKAIIEMVVEWEKRKEKLINTIEHAILSEMAKIEKSD